MLLDDTRGEPIGFARALAEIAVDRPCLAAIGADRPAGIGGCRENRVLDREDQMPARNESPGHLTEQPRQVLDVV